MLKNGQRVKVKPGTTMTSTPGIDPLAGKISKVAEHVGRMEDKEYYNNECYRLIDNSNTCYPRETLWPIDDEPCEEGFLEDFKDMIKETVRV